jgi:hypothetical protein
LLKLFVKKVFVKKVFVGGIFPKFTPYIEKDVPPNKKKGWVMSFLVVPLPSEN